MKILLSAYQCCPNRGSEPGNGWHWATALADLGHDVTVITMPCFRQEIEAAGVEGIDFRYIDVPESPLRSFSPLLGTYYFYRRWQVAAYRFASLQWRQYDVAHHVTWGSLHRGSELWRLPIPLIYGPIGGGQTAPRSYWRYFGRDWPVEKLRTAMTGPLLPLNGRCRRTLQNSAIVLACNSATAIASRRLGATDVRHMMADALPIDWIASPRTKPTGLPVVLWVGRLIPRKAPMLAIRAFAELLQVMPARMVVAGDGPLRKEVLTAIDRLGISDHVQMLGRVDWAEVKRQYDSSSVFLFTSLRESFGAQFLEALGRGLPAVALDHQGIADADVGIAALKVELPARQSQLHSRLAIAMQTILSDDRWEYRSAAGIKWASDCVWSARATAASQIYRDVTGAAQRR